MRAEVVSREHAEHYRWGGADGNESDGWYLVRAESMHVIEERMPAGAVETRHFHARARQFFYVLEGVLTMEVEGALFYLAAGQGIEIAPGDRHQAVNRGGEALRFLVTSVPPSHGDRNRA